MTWLFFINLYANMAFKKCQIKFFNIIFLSCQHLLCTQRISFATLDFSVIELMAWIILKTILKNQGLT